MITALHSDILKYIFAFLSPTDCVITRFVGIRWSQLIPASKGVRCSDYIDNFKLLRWAYDNRCHLDAKTFSKAALRGDLELIKWATTISRLDYSHLISLYAADGGHLAILEWMKDNYNDGWRNNDILERSAEGGHFEVLKWLFSNNVGTSYNIMIKGVLGGNVEMMEWLIQRGYQFVKYEDDYYCSYAAMNGHIEMLKWLRNNAISWSRDTCGSAAKYGHLDTLKWLRQNGCPWDEQTCHAAAARGHLEILQWARANGCPWNEDTANKAKSHLNILKWIVDNGCPVNNGLCDYAAGQGNLELLQWLRSKGCPWDYYTIKYAQDRQHFNVVSWALDNGWPSHHDV
jgi:Ankyrin repeats (many copies)